MTITSFIKILDIFGKSPGFLIKQQLTYTTFVGGILGLIIIIFVAFSIFFFGEELISRKNPSTNKSTEYQAIPGNVTYFSEIEMFVGVQNPTQGSVYYIDDSIYQAKAKLLVMESKVIQYDLNIEPCKNTSFAYFDLFSSFPYNNTLCLSKNQTLASENIKISKAFRQADYHSIQFFFYPCVNTTTSKKCAPQSVIDAHLNKLTISIFVVNNLFNSRNFENPFSKAVSNYFFDCSKNSFVGNVLFLRTVNLYSDVGWMMKDEQLLTTFQHDYVSSTYNTAPYAWFASFGIQMSLLKDEYFRRYYKIQNLAADVGGVFKSLMVICLIIQYHYCENSFYLDLFNHSFQVFDQEWEKQIRLQATMHNIYNCNKSLSINPIIQKNPRMQSIKSMVIPYKYQLRVPFCSKFFRFAFGGSKRLDTFQNGINILKGRMELSQLFKYYMQQDVIKFMLFDASQLHLLEMQQAIPIDAKNIDINYNDTELNIRHYLRRNIRNSTNISNFSSIFDDATKSSSDFNKRFLKLIKDLNHHKEI